MAKIEYLHVAYDFMDNGSGEVMMVMDAPEGGIAADDDNAKFVYDGSAEAMLIRNSDRIVHLPIIPEGMRDMLNEVKILLVTEMDGDDIDDVYEAPIEIVKPPLPIPQVVRGDLRNDHIVEA